MKKLPRWVVFNEKQQKFIIDPAVIYPTYLKRLGYSETTQYGLEVARKCFSRDLRLLIGGPIHIKITKNDAWKLSKFPIGKPKDSVAEYRRIANSGKEK